VFDQAHSQLVGHVELVAVGSKTRFHCFLSGLTPGYHGMHVHEAGNLLAGCESACAHYNPTNASHGGPRGKCRHKGDLGNVFADSQGFCRDDIEADVHLSEIIGRMLVVHESVDDLGEGGDAESKKTGNAGERIACGVIGRL
jgi:Cu/Zn superoxide dismutase